jgi:hypothetical protein
LIEHGDASIGVDMTPIFTGTVSYIGIHTRNTRYTVPDAVATRRLVKIAISMSPGALPLSVPYQCCVA